jgi:hypothetical protein
MSISFGQGLAAFAGGTIDRAKEIDKEVAERVKTLKASKPDELLKTRYKKEYEKFDKEQATLEQVESVGADTEKGQMLLLGIESQDEYRKMLSSDNTLYAKMRTAPTAPKYTPTDYNLSGPNTAQRLWASMTGDDKTADAGAIESTAGSTTTFRRGQGIEQTPEGEVRMDKWRGQFEYEKLLSDSSAGVKQRFLQYKNNLSNFPREAEAVKGLKGAELDNKLLAIAFAQEEYESGTAGSFSPSDAYWDAKGGALTIDDSGVILSTNTGDKKVDSINNQINNINAKITTAADPQDNKKNTAQVKLLQQNKEKHLTGLEDWKAKVDEAAYKNLLNAKSTGQREEYFATQLGNLGNIIKGIEGNDLTTSKYRTKGYKESNKAGGPFTLKGKHLYNNLENAQMYSNSHAVMVAKGDKATPLSSLSFEAINSKISSDIVKRTFTYIDKGLYDTDAIFSIPYPSKDFVGVEYQEEYNVASWTKLIDDYVNDSDDLTDDSLQRKLNSLYDDIRDGTITIPSNVDVGVDVTPLPEPIPVSELQPGELGHIVTKVKEGKNITYIMTDKGYIPYDTSPVTPIVDTPIVEQTIGQQLATLLLTTQKTIKDIKQQASIDLSAAVSSDSKKIINQKALLAIKTAETQYLKDRATLEGK